MKPPTMKIRSDFVIVTIVASVIIGCAPYHSPQAASDPVAADALHLPTLGSNIKATGAVPTNAQIMAQSAQTWPEYHLTASGIPFIIGADDDGIIRCISTDDPRFVTPDGIHAGMSYQELREILGRQAVPEGGWACIVLARSGWHAAFAEGPAQTELPLMPNSHLKWVFQRIGYGDVSTELHYWRIEHQTP